MSPSVAALAHYQELARVAKLESQNMKLKLALMDARNFIDDACKQGCLNRGACAPMLAVYDAVLLEAA